MDVDVALAEVPVNLLPLLDDTDFKAIEAAVAIAQPWAVVTVEPEKCQRESPRS